jgi:hypothetical protein
VHRSVLTNREYIAFAGKHTVEVICMQDLDRALAEKDPQVKTYRAKDRYGDKSEYLVKFPGLTVDDLRDLAESKALEYMEGGLMPATVIVDPHSLEKIGGIPRSMRTAGEFIKAIAPHAKALKVKYGDGVDREIWDAVEAGGVEIDLLLGEGKIPEALAVHRLIAKRVVRQPDIMKRRAQACLEIILEDAAKRLDALEKEIADGRARKVSRELARLARALQETPLADRARKLAAGPAPKDN